MGVNDKKIVFGGWQEAFSEVRNKANTLAGSNREFYIGATEDPDARFRDHATWEWREMHLLYETRSKSFAKKMETMLIKWGENSKWARRLNNKRGGGGGLRDGADYYWLYVVVY